MDLNLGGKYVIVSGAANGLGSATFIALLSEGAIPIGIDIEELQGSELEERLHANNSTTEFHFFHGDAADNDKMKGYLSSFSTIYGLVNNAGLLGDDNAHGGRTEESYEKMMRAHVKSAFVLTELAYPKMKEGGSIVNIGSIETTMAAPDVVLYTMAKGALLGHTISYAIALAPHAIRVNMISPGNMNTKRNCAQYQEGEARTMLERFEQRTPFGRSMEPEEIANSVVWFLSEKNSAMTGQEIGIDCGYARALWDPGWTKK